LVPVNFIEALPCLSRRGRLWTGKDRHMGQPLPQCN
jgi:hypothetical protein